MRSVFPSIANFQVMGMYIGRLFRKVFYCAVVYLPTGKIPKGRIISSYLCMPEWNRCIQNTWYPTNMNGSCWKNKNLVPLEQLRSQQIASKYLWLRWLVVVSIHQIILHTSSNDANVSRLWESVCVTAIFYA